MHIYEKIYFIKCIFKLILEKDMLQKCLYLGAISLFSSSELFFCCILCIYFYFIIYLFVLPFYLYLFYSI